MPNPSGAPGFGCANSFNLDGSALFASGSVHPDTLRLECAIAPGYFGYAFAVKGNAQSTTGIANGDGVRCVSGALVRFGGHNAGANGDASGTWSYPNTAQTWSVTTATAQSAGATAYYQLLYRNAIAGFCSAGTTNWASAVEVFWPVP